MERRLWIYTNDFGWFAVDPEEYQYNRILVDIAPVILEDDTRDSFMHKAEEAETRHCHMAGMRDGTYCPILGQSVTDILSYPVRFASPPHRTWPNIIDGMLLAISYRTV